jgi:hypothetical protein
MADPCLMGFIWVKRLSNWIFSFFLSLLISAFFIMIYNKFNSRNGEIVPRQKLYPENDLVHLSIRIPVSIRQMIQSHSQENHCSLDKKIVWLLARSLKNANQAQPPAEK